jgi:hypothetical protein
VHSKRFIVATGGAQTKLSGTAQCGKADFQQTIPVGDRAEHSISLQQNKCPWSRPLEIGGDKSKGGVNTATGDNNGDSFQVHGFHIATMESGDKAFFRYQGTGTSKDGALLTGKGEWAITGGSGKMKGRKGKGTFSCTPAADGAACEVEGEYAPAKK